MDQLPLRDLHLPEPISWWPPAIGWWLLLMLLFLLGALVFFLVQRHRRATPLKKALEALLDLERSLDRSDQEKLQTISAIFKRFALSMAPRDEVAGLSGDAFLEWILKAMSDQPLLPQIERLTESPYQPVPKDFDPDALIAESRLTLMAMDKSLRRSRFGRLGRSAKGLSTPR